MKYIALGNGRLNSSRLKNKLLLPFANSTLAEIAIKKISNLNNFDNLYYAAFENELIDLCKKYLDHSSIIIRNKESAEANYPITLIHNYLKNIDFDFCMWINSCHALLKQNTIDSAIDFFKKNKFNSMTAVIKKKTWFYDDKKLPINDKDPVKQILTQDSSPIYEVVHAFHIFNKDHLFTTNTYWNNEINDPYLYEIDYIESLDIDNLNEFIISESVYQKTIIQNEY